MAQQPFQAQISAYQKIIDDKISAYSDKVLERVATEYTTYSHDAVSAYLAVLRRGGKRLRGALTIAGYRLAGGEDEHVALRAALAIELIHAYLLVIDDVADQSDTRRGGSSAHKIIETDHRTKHWQGNSNRFGEIIAVHAGMFGNHIAMQELCALPADDSVKLEIMSVVNQTLARTIHGQFNDIFNEVIGTTDEQAVIDALTWKTASYTMVNPLQVGAILAGADAVDMAALEPFGEKLGLAYQLTDDYLGTFGVQNNTGKSNRDDMSEGKMTLMVVRALRRGNQEQKAAILAGLGNRQATDAQFEAFQKALEDSGAAQYCLDMAKDLAHRSLTSLDELPKNWRQRQDWQFLRDLVSYVISRSS